ncbi:hypothetical protein CHS0354_040243 [Potamilus streckersoni]|uniref:WH1 domain-containing protein n=1 Tax=Potamilus streckersoni TaxID=2493646 RepID=A0AAE0S4W7_9BIVA|nr:hypothetical protein CHS0354_040243 [Potamilus streckersoni]
MSSWLAALGPCASPKSKSKSEHKNDSPQSRTSFTLGSLKRRGSLTDIRTGNSRKSTNSRSFREKLQETFEGSLRRAKKTGSLESMSSQRNQTFSNPDATYTSKSRASPSLSHSSSVKTTGSQSPLQMEDSASQAVITHDKFWTNFYNTLPRNQKKNGRPNELTIQDLNQSTGQGADSDGVEAPNGQWSAYATSPRSKRKMKSLGRMNSAPSSHTSPSREMDNLSNLGPQQVEIFDNVTNASMLPRSASLQEDYLGREPRNSSRLDLRKVSPSPDRTVSPAGSPNSIQGTNRSRNRNGTYFEFRTLDRVQDGVYMYEPSSPSASSSSRMTVDTGSMSFSSKSPSICTLETEHHGRFQYPENSYSPSNKANISAQTFSFMEGPYMTPQEYQTHILELIQSLNQPQGRECASSKAHGISIEAETGGQERKSSPKMYKSQKFIVLGVQDQQQMDFTESDHYVKREQPIFTVKAHVFQIDPETKKNWLPSSKQAIPVSYYHDSARGTYRIISVEGSKAIINSTITPSMTFTKTSQKFGQWSDPRANTVYGLGFNTEADLAKFIEKFKDVKELTRQQQHQAHQNSVQQVNGSYDDSPSSSSQSTPQSPARNFLHTRSSSLTSMQGEQPRETVNLKERRNSFNNTAQNNDAAAPPTSQSDAQLRYENDKLKLALAQSSANAKKWEVELQTLKNNNARLTAALQESTANVEEWKKQLAAYKEESSKMKKKVAELEKKPGGSEQVTALQTEIQELRGKLESVQQDNQNKDEEIQRLEERFSEMAAKESTNTGLQNKIKVGGFFRGSSQNESEKLKALEEENRGLASKVQEMKQLLQNYKTGQEQENRDLLRMQDQLGSKITELYEIHEQIVSMLCKESSS